MPRYYLDVCAEQELLDSFQTEEVSVEVATILAHETAVSRATKMPTGANAKAHQQIRLVDEQDHVIAVFPVAAENERP